MTVGTFFFFFFSRVAVVSCVLPVREKARMGKSGERVCVFDDDVRV